MDKHTPAFSTYSVSLYFDGASAAQLRHAAECIALATNNDYMTQHSVPPHITLGMFHAAENDLPLLKTQITNILAELPTQEKTPPTA